MRRAYAIFISLFFASTAFAQQPGFSAESHTNLQTQPSLGISVDALGIFLGTYSLGATTIVTPHIELGLAGRYYDTHFVSPKVQGWQSEFRINYFFSPIEKNGIFLGALGGFESVNIFKDEETGWKKEEDAIWAVIPGYKWSFDSQWHLLVGLRAGHNFGETQITPEIDLVYLF